MTSPFDAIAHDYDALWSRTENGSRQRSEVWAHMKGLVHRGDVILDLGCGTGEDALHFEAAGVRVVAIDSSPEMTAIARSRGVDARCIAIEGLSRITGSFNGAISNFGALNCVHDLAPVGTELARLVRPGGFLALCLISRFCLVETLAFVRALHFRRMVRRWRGHATWRGMDVYYPSSFRVRAALSRWFKLVRTVSIGGGDHTLYIFSRRITC